MFRNILKWLLLTWTFFKQVNKGNVTYGKSQASGYQGLTNFTEVWKRRLAKAHAICTRRSSESLPDNADTWAVGEQPIRRARCLHTHLPTACPGIRANLSPYLPDWAAMSSFFLEISVALMCMQHNRTGHHKTGFILFKNINEKNWVLWFYLLTWKIILNIHYKHQTSL